MHVHVCVCVCVCVGGGGGWGGGNVCVGVGKGVCDQVEYRAPHKLCAQMCCYLQKNRLLVQPYPLFLVPSLFLISGGSCFE